MIRNSVLFLLCGVVLGVYILSPAAGQTTFGSVTGTVTDGTGAVIPNGFFSLDGGTIGLAFNPNGELFVSHHRSGGISRFGFDVSGNPILREHIPTELGLGFVAVYPSVP